MSVNEAFKKYIALPATLASTYENGNKLNSKCSLVIILSQ